MYIYLITNMVNNKQYVGQRNRDYGSDSDYYGSGILIKKEINEYSKNQFKKTLITVCRDKRELNNAEKFWINKLNTVIPHGYNMAPGGAGGSLKGRKVSAEGRERIRLSQIGHKGNHAPKSKRMKKLLSIAKTGKTYKEIYGDNAENVIEKKRASMVGKNLGKKHSQETKDIIGKINKSKPKIKCIHCGKLCSKTNAIRWHNDNCKMKNL